MVGEVAGDVIVSTVGDVDSDETAVDVVGYETLLVIFVLLSTVVITNSVSVNDLVTAAVPAETVVVIVVVVETVCVVVCLMVGPGPPMLNVYCGGMNPETCERRDAVETTAGLGFLMRLPIGSNCMR